jgi:uncharacterized protein (TIGR02145 family)
MRTNIKVIVIVLTLFSVSAFAQQKSTFKDTRDGKTYKAVKIGSQTWMAENLDFDDGKYSWCDPVKPNDPTKCKYGRWYDWATAMNIDTSFNYKKWGKGDSNQLGICPDGWHIPNNAEWQTLVNSVGDNAGKKLKTKTWNVAEITALKFGIANANLSPMEKLVAEEAIFNLQQLEGTDSYSFSALPSGMGSVDEISGKGEAAEWWMSTEGDNATGTSIDFINIRREFSNIELATTMKANKLTVRCVKNER